MALRQGRGCGISVAFEATYPGIVSQAVFLTFGTLGALLLAYRSGLIRATENFKLGVFAATGGIVFVYVIGFVMSFFGAGRRLQTDSHQLLGGWAKPLDRPAERLVDVGQHGALLFGDAPVNVEEVRDVVREQRSRALKPLDQQPGLS